jgi:hypothetical protein
MPHHWRWHRQISLIKGGERGSHLVACGSPTFWMVKVSQRRRPRSRSHRRNGVRVRFVLREAPDLSSAVVGLSSAGAHHSAHRPRARGAAPRQRGGGIRLSPVRNQVDGTSPPRAFAPRVPCSPNTGPLRPAPALRVTHSGKTEREMNKKCNITSSRAGADGILLPNLLHQRRRRRGAARDRGRDAQGPNHA